MIENAEIAQLLKQRTWDKELNLWVGPEHKLRPHMDGMRQETVDLLDLLDDELPGGDNEVRSHLVKAIRQHLKSISRVRGQQTVLIVRSAALLARFGVGVREFYEWFCDDFSIVFLVIEGRCSEANWPDEVECQTNQLIDYFSEASALIKRQFEA